MSIIVNEDAAHTCISDLGKLGMIQFTDLNPELTAFQRRYVAYIKRIDELERKLAFFGEEVRAVRKMVHASRLSAVEFRLHIAIVVAAVSLAAFCTLLCMHTPVTACLCSVCISPFQMGVLVCVHLRCFLLPCSLYCGTLFQRTLLYLARPNLGVLPTLIAHGTWYRTTAICKRL